MFAVRNSSHSGANVQFENVSVSWKHRKIRPREVDDLAQSLDVSPFWNLKSWSEAVANVNLAKACQHWHRSILGFGPLIHGNALILLCRASGWKNGASHCGRSLQVARGHASVLCYLSSNYSCPETVVCNLWSSTTASFGIMAYNFLLLSLLLS